MSSHEAPFIRPRNNDVSPYARPSHVDDNNGPVSLAGLLQAHEERTGGVGRHEPRRHERHENDSPTTSEPITSCSLDENPTDHGDHHHLLLGAATAEEEDGGASSSIEDRHHHHHEEEEAEGSIEEVALPWSELMVDGVQRVGVGLDRGEKWVVQWFAAHWAPVTLVTVGLATPFVVHYAGRGVLRLLSSRGGGSPKPSMLVSCRDVAPDVVLTHAQGGYPPSPDWATRTQAAAAVVGSLASVGHWWRTHWQHIYHAFLGTHPDTGGLKVALMVPLFSALLVRLLAHSAEQPPPSQRRGRSVSLAASSGVAGGGAGMGGEENATHLTSGLWMHSGPPYYPRGEGGGTDEDLPDGEGRDASKPPGPVPDSYWSRDGSQQQQYHHHQHQASTPPLQLPPLSRRRQLSSIEGGGGSSFDDHILEEPSGQRTARHPSHQQQPPGPPLSPETRRRVDEIAVIGTPNQSPNPRLRTTPPTSHVARSVAAVAEWGGGPSTEAVGQTIPPPPPAAASLTFPTHHVGPAIVSPLPQQPPPTDNYRHHVGEEGQAPEAAWSSRSQQQNVTGLLLAPPVRTPPLSPSVPPFVPPIRGLGAPPPPSASALAAAAIAGDMGGYEEERWDPWVPPVKVSRMGVPNEVRHHQSNQHQQHLPHQPSSLGRETKAPPAAMNSNAVFSRLSSTNTAVSETSTPGSTARKVTAGGTNKPKPKGAKKKALTPMTTSAVTSAGGNTRGSKGARGGGGAAATDSPAATPIDEVATPALPTSSQFSRSSQQQQPSYRLDRPDTPPLLRQADPPSLSPLREASSGASGAACGSPSPTTGMGSLGPTTAGSSTEAIGGSSRTKDTRGCYQPSSSQAKVEGPTSLAEIDLSQLGAGHQRSCPPVIAAEPQPPQRAAVNTTSSTASSPARHLTPLATARPARTEQEEHDSVATQTTELRPLRPTQPATATEPPVAVIDDAALQGGYTPVSASTTADSQGTLSVLGTSPILYHSGTIGLALASTCNAFDLAAFTTAAVKYQAREVLIVAAPGNTTLDLSLSTQDQTRLESNGIPVTEVGNLQDFVTARNNTITSLAGTHSYGVLAAQQRSLLLSEDAAMVPRPIPGNRLATVAVHKARVPGAIVLQQFQHPRDAIYVFHKTTSPPSESSGSRTNSPDQQAAAYSLPAHVSTQHSINRSNSAQSDISSSTWRSMIDAEQQSVAWCDYHVYLSAEQPYNSLPALVNIVLYDRAAKTRKELFHSAA